MLKSYTKDESSRVISYLNKVSIYVKINIVLGTIFVISIYFFVGGKICEYKM